ncbi:unnamed protein product [Moneuplotes crassus]|uniref:Uncharacterized protein n=1 Tax=Euplotes crassus TaxID=5936 RepID=A0AAD1XZX2_EUPCR|nr:unnamed protein product [Moneuplotes crassus]
MEEEKNYQKINYEENLEELKFDQVMTLEEDPALSAGVVRRTAESRMGKLSKDINSLASQVYRRMDTLEFQMNTLGDRVRKVEERLSALEWSTDALGNKVTEGFNKMTEGFNKMTEDSTEWKTK